MPNLTMAIAVKPYTGWYVRSPQRPNVDGHLYLESDRDKIAWLILRQLSDIPTRGRALFAGSLAEKKTRHREFINFVRQGKTYWEAGALTRGSAAALPYYYGALNLAKAELLTSHPTEILGSQINHGLTIRLNNSTSVRKHHLETVPGVFTLLFEKRTGITLTNGTKIPVSNLLSLLPEISLEMQELGPRRPPSSSGYQAIMLDATHAWSIVVFPKWAVADPREPAVRLLKSQYEEVDPTTFLQWREVFALSRRIPGSFSIYQSKKHHSLPGANGVRIPYAEGAVLELCQLLGSHISEPIGYQAEFLLTHSLSKSDPLVVPLGLVRYAAMYYLSSLVRYRPSLLDQNSQGAIAWVMDSFVKEVPDSLLINAVGGISNSALFFEPNGHRV
jgi:hypothetical protein